MKHARARTRHQHRARQLDGIASLTCQYRNLAPMNQCKTKLLGTSWTNSGIVSSTGSSGSALML